MTQVHIGPFALKVDTSVQHNPDIYFEGTLTLREDRYLGVNEELLDQLQRGKD